MRDGNLTVADLSRLLERPYPTVRGWVQGVAIGGAQLDAAFVLAKLEKLERRIKSRDQLPVPRLHPSKRIQYVDRLRRP
jgi:hypothetical protein